LYSADVDIYACAMGATINNDTVYKIKAKVMLVLLIINWQMKMFTVPFYKKRHFYAPDFLINAGGIINVYAELAHYDRAEIMRKTENIYNTTLEIFDFALAISQHIRQL
jgi:leucine dehydrogenase